MTKTANAPARTRRNASASDGATKRTPKLAHPAKVTPAPKPKVPSKGDTLIKLLSSPEGASIAEMMKATGWQQHSVRGFLAGTVKKKLGHELGSQMLEGVRVYRINLGKAAS
jgi:hypothetical protein